MENAHHFERGACLWFMDRGGENACSKKLDAAMSFVFATAANIEVDIVNPVRMNDEEIFDGE